MIINGAGSYRPSNYEALLADWQKSREQSLFDYAAMNNARARAAQRAAAGVIFGGSAEEQQRALFSTRTGAMIRYGSQFTENLLGSGSYVDMMGAVMNVAQNAGFAGSAFGKTASPIYGPGMVTDILAKKMFQGANNYFSTAAGTDNLLRTQGLSITDLAGIQQAMASKGMFYGRNIVSVEEADLAKRALSAAGGLADTGNNVAADQIRKAVTDAAGNEVTLKQALQKIKESTSSGDLKGALETAFKTTSVTTVNDSEVNQIQRETTQMAKALVKLRNIYGDVAGTDIFNAAGAMSGGGFRDPNQLLADMQRFESMARVYGYGDNLQGVAQQQAGIASALSSVFGSTITGGSMATSTNFNVLARQRLTMGFQKHLTDQQVAENVVADVASTAKENNMVEATRLAFEANNTADPAKIAAASEMLRSLNGELDPGKQLDIIRKARKSIGADVRTRSGQNEQIQALAGTSLGTQLTDVFNTTGKLSVLRMYEDSFTDRGLSSKDRASALAILRGLGSGRFDELINNAPITAEDMSFINKAGGNSTDVIDFLRNENARNIARSGALDIRARNKSALITGTKADEEAMQALSIDAAKVARFGDEQADPLKGENILRIGLRVLADGGKSVSAQDIRDYIFATSKDSPAFSVNYDTGAFSANEAQIEQIAKTLGVDTQTIKNFTTSKSGFSDFSQLATKKGIQIGTNAKGEGRLITNLEFDKIGNELTTTIAPNLALERIGLGAFVDLDPAKRKAEAEKMLKAYIRPDQNIFGIPTKNINDVAAEKARDVIESKGFDQSPEQQEKRRMFAEQISKLIEYSGANEEMDELGKDLLTDSEYKGMREQFGLKDLTQETRKALAEDTQTSKKFAEYALNRARGANETDAEKAFIEELRSGNVGGKGSQNVTTMNITNAHFVGNITGFENIIKK